jgi:hypothetical protein
MREFWGTTNNQFPQSLLLTATSVPLRLAQLILFLMLPANMASPVTLGLRVHDLPVNLDHT